MKANFYHEETLSIPAYRAIIRNAVKRLKIWHNKLPDLRVRHNFMRREVNMIRHCKHMIELIQSQLN